MPRIARVEPLTTARALRGPFDYLVEDERFARVAVGSVLEVPFARRKLVGVVTGLAPESEVPSDRLAVPIRTLEPGLPSELVELAVWIAREYCSTPARALSLVLAPGTTSGARPRELLVAQLTRAGAEALDGGINHAGAEARDRATPAARLTPNQTAVLKRLRDAGPLTAAAVGASHDALRRLAGRGLIEVGPRAVGRRPTHAVVGARADSPPPLTADQQQVLADVVAAVAAGRRASFLLHGVTGSGKTEIYLQAAAATLERGRAVIVMVPEIALTPQTISRFVARFGDTVAVLHSRLRRGERYDEWARLRSGDARVCVGPRSAVFAPVRDLGLVVVDEEHDASYKNEGDPRYDARSVAAQRAFAAGSVLLAGSATPRPESVHALERLRLARRVDGSAMPATEILDMRESNHALHPRTSEALAAVRARGEKAIVLLNRRGWSNYLSCRSCGRTWACRACDVTLVLHAGAGFLGCHHCGHRERAPTICPDCRSVSVARHGAGTERLEAELRAALGGGGFEVLRLDADTVGGGRPAAGVLRAFEGARGAVLVGTQMVAKGHDFPDVSLAVVLDADATLRFPDFRAEERTFSMVAQLAGRAGRGNDGARVLVQTLDPESEAIRLAAAHDSERFLERELARRRALGYPPFSDLIKVVCSARESVLATAAADELAARIRAPGATLLGPAPLFRRKGWERSQIVVKATDRGAAVAATGSAVAALAAGRGHAGVRLSVDVDPQ